MTTSSRASARRDRPSRRRARPSPPPEWRCGPRAGRASAGRPSPSRVEAEHGARLAARAAALSRKKRPGCPLRGSPAELFRGAPSGGGGGPRANVGAITTAPRPVGPNRRKSRARTDSCGFRWLTAVRQPVPGRDRRVSEAWFGTPTSRGWAARDPAAAASRSASDSNRPKQVAPEPDMRAMRAPASASSTSPISGTSAPRRRFEIVAARLASRRAGRGRRRPRPRTRPRSTADAGIDQQHRRAGQAVDLDRLERVAPALAPRGSAQQAGGDVGAEARRGRTVHRAAHRQAAAAPPPRRPSRRRARPRPAASCRGVSAAPAPERPRGLAAPDCRARPASSPANGPVNVERQPVALPRGQHVAILAEGEDRLDPVIAVRLPRPHVQREVELRVGDLAHQRAASSRRQAACRSWRAAGSRPRPRHRPSAAAQAKRASTRRPAAK